jgi:hypothetical protein
MLARPVAQIHHFDAQDPTVVQARVLMRCAQARQAWPDPEPLPSG